MPSAFDNLFASCNPAFLSAFAVTVSLHPAGVALDARNVKVIPLDANQIFLAETLRRDERLIQISSRNNTEGRTAPQTINDFQGAADKYVIDGQTWWCVAIIEDGRVNGSGMHTLKIRNKQAAGD